MQRLEKIIRLGLYAALLLPLMFTGRTMYPWHFGKTVIFQIIVDVLVVLTAFFLYRTKQKFFRFHSLDWLVVAFLATQLIATIVGVDPTRSFWGYQSRAQGVIVWIHFVLFYILLRQWLTQKKQWESLLLWVVGIGVISCLIAFIGPHISFFDGRIASGDRLNGLVGNALFLASYLVLPLTCALYLYFSRDQAAWRKWGILAATILLFITTLYTQTRGVLVGMVAGGSIALVLFVFFGGIKRKQKHVTVGIGIALALVGIGLYELNQRSTVIAEHAPFAARILSIHIGDATVSTRFMAWKIAGQAWLDRPMFGWGPENFQHAFDRHYNPLFLRFSFAETVWDKPHNVFLEILATTGLVGFLTYLGLLGTLFWFLKGLIAKESNPSGRAQYIVIVGGLIAYLVQSMFSIETTNSLQLWYLLLAFVGSMYVAMAVSDTASKKHEVALGTLPLLASVVVMGYFLLMDMRTYHASVLMGDARDAAEAGMADLWHARAKETLAYPIPFMNEQAMLTIQDISKLDTYSLITKERLADVAPQLVERLKQESEKRPDLYQHHFWLSEIYGAMGEYIDPMYTDLANQELMKAGELSPEQQRVPLLLSKNYIIQGRVEEGIQLLEALIEKDPVPPEPHWFLGLALTEHGDKDRGIQELEKGLDFGRQFRSSLLYMINLYAEREEYDKIPRLYRWLIEREPTNASLYASMAATYAAIGDREHTVEYLNKAVALDPSLKEEALLFLQKQGIDVSANN